jgi:hypothetical protein
MARPSRETQTRLYLHEEYRKAEWPSFLEMEVVGTSVSSFA